MPGSDPRLAGRAVLITGGGTGVGRSTAELFAREGAEVFLVARREEPLARVAGDIRAAGGRAAFLCIDVSAADAGDRAVEAAVRELGGLDILVNNAGWVPDWTPIHDTADEAWERALAVNLTGPFRLARAALPHLAERTGVIVNVSSISALRARNAVAAYAAAKAGLLALTRCIAAEYGWKGIRCNCVIPSWAETPMTTGYLEDDGVRSEVAGRHMLRRVAGPAEVARTILFLASDEASFITGTAVPVDGGMMSL